MNPDLAVALRIILTLAGGGFVTRGTITETMLEQLVGAILTIAAIAWGWWSNRPHSGEAQVIAEKVAEDPSAAPDIVKLSPTQNVVEVDLNGRRSSDHVEVRNTTPIVTGAGDAGPEGMM